MSGPDTNTGSAAVPRTVLVDEMGDDALLLQGWRAGPSARVCAADAGPLREALTAAFGSDLVSAGRSGAVQAQP
jgi:hypothetical protein